MAQASEGKRKTKNKAKVASPMRGKGRGQGDNQLLRESRTLDHSSERDPMSVSRPPSPTQSDPDRLTTDPSDGADLARYDDDSQSQGGMESDDGEKAGFSTHPTHMEGAWGNNGEDIHSRIAERAFLLYAESGFQHGHDLDHWLEAEREILIGHEHTYHKPEEGYNDALRTA